MNVVLEVNRADQINRRLRMTRKALVRSLINEPKQSATMRKRTCQNDVHLRGQRISDVWKYTISTPTPVMRGGTELS